MPFSQKHGSYLSSGPLELAIGTLRTGGLVSTRAIIIRTASIVWATLVIGASAAGSARPWPR